MRILQLVKSLTYGDAVGNDALALHDIFREFDPDTRIYAFDVDKRRIEGDVYDEIGSLPDLDEEDIVFYHVATGSALLRNLVRKLPCRKFLIYHNITPPHFFHGYSALAECATKDAYKDLAAMRGYVEGCLADSGYNRQELMKMGFNMPMAVLPVLVPFGDYLQPPAQELLRRYQGDGWENILFVGRIVPHKKIEHIIAAFACYRQHYQEKARLFLVGNADGQEVYLDRLNRYVEALGVGDVIFSGHVPFRDILAYYHLADVFLCMSEHEGFCVPLLEAMHFRIPVLAYGQAAVPWTLGGAGVAFADNEPGKVAELLSRVMKDQALREEILAGQEKRLAEFSYERVAAQVRELLQKIIAHEDFSTPLEGQPQSASSSLVAQALREAEAAPAASMKRFQDIPLQAGSRPLRRRAMARAYHLLHLLSPVMAERVKNFIKHKR